MITSERYRAVEAVLINLAQRTHFSILHVGRTLRAPVNTELRRRIEALLGRGERRFLLDLGSLASIDAAGVGELVRAFNTTNAAGGVLQIAHARRRVRQLLHLAGVLRHLKIGSARAVGTLSFCRPNR